MPAQAATPPTLMRPPASIVDTVDAAANFVWVNTLRVAAGAPPVTTQSWAAGVAQAHSLDMANQGSLFHNITGYMDQGHAAMNAVYLGENVAMGTTLAYAQAALQASPPHMAILLDPKYNYVGIGAATDASGQVWITEDFAEITGAAAATTVAAKPAAPAPKPAAPAPKPVAPAPKPAVVTAPKPAVVTAPKPVVAPASVTSPIPLSSPPAPSPAAPAPAPAVTHAPATTSATSQSHSQEAAAKLTSHRTAAGTGATLLYATLVLLGVAFALGLGFEVTKLMPTR